MKIPNIIIVYCPQAAKAEASSVYSQAGFGRQGFETLATYEYAEYHGRDEVGNNVFGDTGMNKTIALVARRLPTFNSGVNLQ